MWNCLCWCLTLPETNSSHLKMVVSKFGISFFQGFTFRGELLVSGSVLLQCINRMKPTKPTMFSHENREHLENSNPPANRAFCDLWFQGVSHFFGRGGTKLSSLLLKPVARPAFFLRWNSLRKKGWKVSHSSVRFFWDLKPSRFKGNVRYRRKVLHHARRGPGP